MSSAKENMTPELASTSVQHAIEQPRIAIETVRPVVSAGRFPAKAVVGRSVDVSAIIFTDGHVKLAAQCLWRYQGESEWHSAPLRLLGNDLWQGEFTCTRIGQVEFTMESWVAGYLSYCDELEKKFAANVDIAVELQEGANLLRDILAASSAKHRADIFALMNQLEENSSAEEKVAVLLSPDSIAVVCDAEPRAHCVRSETYCVEVERKAAEFASWYELFPRSVTSDASRHGTFKDVMARLPEISAMGFDVLYFRPIHPIGLTHRKGRNNCLIAYPSDPGSPYAIGSEDGGHDAIHPQLGTLEDFLELVEAAHQHGLEIALDFAIQCSPDHPWLVQHPGWFSWRPDGTLRYAENPPKKYEDIVNVDFYTEKAIPSLWLALRDVVLLWVERGVRMFRVDNPHTKPMPFWEWLIADVRSTCPDVIFLAEAFTRPAMMARLGKLGFSQSYSYFTWRNSKQELVNFFTELNASPWRDCYRPNFFVNTPDINPYFLHDSGRAGFLIRAALATMGSGLWGMYSGFEICEAAPLPSKEEYLDSEKYQIRPRKFDVKGNIVHEITQLNRIRRDNPALHTHLGLQIYQVWNDNIILFGKHTADLSNFILIAVSLDPHNAQEGHFELPLWEFDLPDDAAMGGQDLMNGHSWTWYGKRQWMRIEPWHQPFGIWRLQPTFESE